jgi:uncharacterized delta-60 repeat protein
MSNRNYLFFLCIVGIIVLTGTASASVPVAGFSGTPIVGHAPLTVTFTDLSTESPTGWAWYFGDEDFTEPWTQMTASAEWSGRYSHTSVTMPDGSIVMMGGCDSSGYKNDVWRSTDNGVTWTQMTGSAEWSGRYSHTSVTMPDGSIVLMGGYDGITYKNDVWRSTDNGATWIQMTASAEWVGRAFYSSVVTPDGSIVLMGGASQNGILNDVWRSTDNGATWTLMTANAGWLARNAFNSVAMPDGSIVLMGGYTPSVMNDVWRSTDNGATWTIVNSNADWSARGFFSSVVMPDGSIILMGGATNVLNPNNDVWRTTDNGVTWTQLSNAGWPERFSHTSVVMPDGSIVLMGGGIKSDVWRLMPAGSSAQNPTRTYTTPGTYSVALQAYNAGGFNSARKIDYITVSEAAPPVAGFSGTPTTGINPLTVVFTDKSTGSPTGWAWYFGDESYAEPWTQMTASAGWSARHAHSSVVMPDGSIVLMGGVGFDVPSAHNDVWRSTDNGAHWTQQTANAEWSARLGHSSVVMPDGSIVLMGGYSNGGWKNDVWRSADNGAHWTQQTANAEWSARHTHSSVVMPDGSIVLMGGRDSNNLYNDVWQSTDYGVHWKQQTANAEWSARCTHSSVAMPDGSIVLMGGMVDWSVILKNDVWRSKDNGATWTEMAAGAGWSARGAHSSVVMPDGSIVLMGGVGNSGGDFKNDVWRSMDNGATWTQVTAGAGWTGRAYHTSVVMPDGSIVLTGGYVGGGVANDVWRLMPAGSSLQNPIHTYPATGSYNVSLTVANDFGFNTVTKQKYILVTKEGTPILEFPSIFLPITMIIGMLGAVLLIQRTREH